MSLPTRKSNRLKGHNYSHNGFYFITICTKNRNEILSAISTNQSSDKTINELTNLGELVKKHILKIETSYLNIKLKNYVIMPNHIHLIIAMMQQDFYNEKFNQTPSSASIPRIISTLKSLTTKEFGSPIWQRNYHDRIIRNEIEYQKVYEYIDNNHLKWEIDCHNKNSPKYTDF